MSDSSGPASDTGGVKAFAIARRMVRERERLLGMTDEERAWRAQWLKDQHLAPDEPVIDQAKHYRENFNPIRRFYRAPLDRFGEMITPAMGYHNAMVTRWFVGKVLLGIAGLYGAFYYLKYNQNDWMRRGGWRVISSKRPVFPGDPNYPEPSTRSKPSDYANRGFNQSPI